MIKSLHIQNFQSHKDTTLDFDPGVNIIIGPTDSGKTAIIRALRWLRWNRPSGDSIRSNWEGETSVELITDDCKVVRSKGTEEVYKLNKTRFTAFKTDVPKEIQDALNISEINLQSQLDAPFLLSSSPGEVAQHFNKVAKLDKIDSSTSNVNKWIRELTSSINYQEKENERLTEELKQFDHLEKFEAELEVIEDLENKLLSKYDKYNKLTALIKKINENQNELDEASEILKFEKPVNNLLNLYAKLHEKEEEYESLSRLRIKLINLGKDIEKWNNTYTILSRRFKDEFPNICPLCGKPK